MPITISADQRNALYDLLLDHLNAIGDVWTALRKGNVADAARLGGWYADEMRLLDDLGSGKRSERTSFELTMPPVHLKRLLARLHKKQHRGGADLPLPAQGRGGGAGLLLAAATCGELMNAMPQFDDEEVAQ
jgi:hypothetical protein